MRLFLGTVSACKRGRHLCNQNIMKVVLNIEAILIKWIKNGSFRELQSIVCDVLVKFS